MTPNVFLRNKGGIYGIRQKSTNKIYVGRTKCFYRRAYQHIRSFNESSSASINPHLFNAMTKYGIEDFEMFPLEFCDVKYQNQQELWWMQNFNCCDKNLGFNIRKDSEGGMETSQETSEKISKNLKKQWDSGIRDGHGDKLKKSWENDYTRKFKQSQLFKKLKTKYTYYITDETGSTIEGDYSLLKKMKLTSVMSNFKRRNSDEAWCKGYKIKRIRINKNI